MSLFDWFRRKSSIRRIDDLVWLSDDVKRQGIRNSIERRLAEDQLVLLITHFPETFCRMQDLLDQAALNYEIVSDRLHGPAVMDFLSESPKIALAPATAIVEGEETLPGLDSPKVSILVAERHPIRTPDHLVEAFARSLPCATRLTYFLSIDDPLLSVFVSPKNLRLLQRGATANEAVSSSMITRRITAAQKRIEQQVGRPKAAETIEEWLSVNGLS